MTYYKCLKKCDRNCDKICKELCEHTNKNCHLKKCRCCVRDSSKSVDNETEVEAKLCETCCSLIKYCTCRQSGRNKSRYRDTSQLRRDKSPEQKMCKVCCYTVTKCICRRKSPVRKSRKSDNRCKCCETQQTQQRKMCEICCCLLINCTCKKKSDACRPRILCEDLPLYDEKSHLIGYIKRGSIIDDPSCGKSRDRELENSSMEREGQPRLTADIGCMASCRYAEGLRRHAGTEAAPRWTTRSSFDHATRKDRSTEKHKSRRCPCK